MKAEILAAMLLIGACAEGAPIDSGSFGGPLPQVTSATTPSGMESSGGETEVSDGNSTGSEKPSTTTGDPTPDMTSSSGTTGPANTTDPSTGVDPSTSGDVDPSTTSGDNTTGEPLPPPPPKDPQPVAGLYESCLDNTPCDGNTDGCFTLTDANMNVTDGYCTLLCDSVADCGAKPVCTAVQECLNIAPGQNVCALKCVDANNCPTGMGCTETNLGFYCF